jgi:hypothetical protein
MTDEELEHLLGRYHPTAPPASLRARVLHAAIGRSRQVRLEFVDYVLAGVAAAVVVTAVLFEAPPATPTIEAAREREITELAAALGGGPDAMQYAAMVVSREAELVDPASREGSW